MIGERAERAELMGPFFEIQLQFAARISEQTGQSLGDVALHYTHIHRRLALGVPGFAPLSDVWRAYAESLERATDLAGQVSATKAAYVAAADEVSPLPGQFGAGCFAHEPPKSDGSVKIHFYNLDTDEAGGPLASDKVELRRADLRALTRHIVEAHPEATRIVGRSWLYNLEAYRRLFPPDYAASRAPASEPIHLSGTSSWGQLIDSRQKVRAEVRNAFLSNLDSLDPAAPWRAFPFQVLEVAAPLASFEAFYGL